MMNSSDLDERIDRLINNELSHLLTKEIGPCTCQFLKVDDGGDLKPFASGIMAEIDDSFYILTASHVIEDWSDSNKLFVPIGNTHISVVGKAIGSVIEKGEKIDYGYIKLKKELVPYLLGWYRFLTIDKFFFDRKELLEANYCAYGYAVENQKKHNGILKPLASAYWVRPAQDKVFEHYGFSPLLHYVLDYRGSAVNITTGETEKIRTAHYGLSGGGLWYTHIDFNGSRLISEARLIGIMTEFRRGKYECLIANRIEWLISAIKNHD